MVDSKDTSNFKVFHTPIELSFLLYLNSAMVIGEESGILSSRDSHFRGNDDLNRLGINHLEVEYKQHAKLLLLLDKLMSSLEHLLRKPIAHRALVSKELPENSFSAVEAAVKKDVGVEVDVRVTKDGVVVLFHDRDLQKITGEDTRVEDLLYEELQSLCAKKGKDVTTLSAVLQVIGGKVPLLVEIKNEGLPGSLERETWKLLQDYSGPVALQSFNPLSLLFIKGLMKDDEKIPIGILTTSFTNNGSHDDEVPTAIKALLRSQLLTLLCHPDFLACDVQDLPNFYLKLIASLRQIPTIAWTVDDESSRQQASNHATIYIGEGDLLLKDPLLPMKRPNPLAQRLKGIVRDLQDPYATALAAAYKASDAAKSIAGSQGQDTTRSGNTKAM